MAAVVIIDEMHSSIISQLESIGFRVDYQPDITREHLLDVIADYQGLIVRSKTLVDQDLIARASKLKFVARAGAGVDNLDEQLLIQKGVHIINAPEGNRDSLGEHMVGVLLNLLHRISEAHNATRQGAWSRERFRGTELAGKTVGIIGCGNMGNAFARRLASFDCKVLGYDKYLPAVYSSNYQRVSLNELHINCDIISLHVPLTAETRSFYNYSFFKQFRTPIVLLNSARGEILPLRDLVELMEEGKIVAAGLDVFEVEPLNQLSNNQKDTYKYLVNSPLVLLTPHIAGWSHESYTRINDVLVAKIGELQASGSID